MTALKFDGGKPPMDLLARSYLDGVALVLGFGAQKYAKHNWRQGMDWSRLVGAAMRHLTAWNDGEDTDPESGLSHLFHAGCCLMFLAEYQAKGLGNDDRYKPPATKEQLVCCSTCLYSKKRSNEEPCNACIEGSQIGDPFPFFAPIPDVKD